MSINHVEPLTKEEIEIIDSLRANDLLMIELCQIPEFITLWRIARSEVTPILESIGSHLKRQFSSLSPLTQGMIKVSIFQSEREALSIYGEDVINEAEEFRHFLRDFQQALKEFDKRLNLSIGYHNKLKEIVEPLGIPAYYDYMLMLDTKLWGINKILYGPIHESTSDLLESQILRAITGLGPAELGVTKHQITLKRIMKFISPARWHMTRHYLPQRIHLWVRNAVYGETQEQIAARIQNDENWFGVGSNPFEWVRKQIHDANRILGVVRKGRTRKGGVLRQWKMMIK